MLRNLFRPLCGVAFAAIVAATVAGCSDDTTGFDVPEQQQPESGYITISLNCVDDELAEASRAGENDAPYTEEGDKDRHENLISTVTLCLWAKGGDKPDDTAKPDYWQTFVVNKEQTAEVRVPLTPALKRVLFETTGATCNAFAAVNVTPTSPDFTIADLRNMAIGSKFATQRTQDDFTMDGDCLVSYNAASDRATGTIDLHRSASKITLALDVDNIIEQTVVIDGNIVTSHWAPDYSGMRVRLNGGLSKSRLDPNLDEKPAQTDFFDTPDNLVYGFAENKAGEEGKPDNGNNAPAGKNYSYIQDRPFYTYPHRWSAEPGDYAATYMTLSIPWQAVEVDEDGNVTEESNQWRTCYYQVPVIAADSELLQLVRNVSYHVYLHVGILGSFVPDEPLLLENLEYSAAQWGTEQMDVTIPDVRYLVVDQNSYTVNNETSIAIPFYTSHKTVVTDATMTFYRYNYDDVGRELPVRVTKAKNDESAKSHTINGTSVAGAPVFIADFNNDTKTLNVTHDLVMYEGMTSGNAPVSFTQGDNKDMGIRAPRTETQWNNLMNTISYFRKVQPTAAITDVTEYSRVEYEITVQHEDIYEEDKKLPTPSGNFKEVIKITQYPGMYITTVQNYCPATSVNFDYSGAQGNTIINGCYSGLPESMSHYLNGDNNSADRTTLYQGIYSTQYYGWCTSIGLTANQNLTLSNLNFNPNMYLVTVTTLSTEQGEKYNIGDPRSKVINNYLQDGTTSGSNNPLPTGEDTRVWTNSMTTTYTYDRAGTTLTSTARGFVRAAALDANGNLAPNQRTLQYYYPTLETSATKMMIAPKFRICSSYAGTTWILNRELARRRAAAYQEMGYPAGRWRLPTYGEVSFIMDLAAQYKIPRLFGTNSSTWWYWCAHGLVTVPGKDKEQGPSLPNNASGYDPSIITVNAPVAQRARFVYDEWYWGDETLSANGTVSEDREAPPIYTFTWGDRKINF